MRWWNYGDPLFIPHQKLGGPRIDIGDRFWSKVDFSNPDECWLWSGSKHGNGYGEVWRDGVRVYAHRAAYELVYEALGPGEEVCHHCDTPLCVRPDHLFAGTQGDNVRDMWAKGRGVKPPVKRAKA